LIEIGTFKYMYIYINTYVEEEELPEQDSQNGTTRMGQPKWDRQNKAARTGQTKLDSQN
jgi:hypothetical protein